MLDENQFGQLMLQYKQLKAGAEDIYEMIQNEDFDSALTMINSRKPIFLNCQCMRNFLELTPAQEQQANSMLNEIKELELRNIQLLSESMENVKTELKKVQKNEKLQSAYEFNDEISGSIINLKE